MSGPRGSRRKRRTSIEGQFAPRTIEMISSHAFRALSLSARRVLDRLEIELAAHGGNDNGRLPTTYGNFCDYGLDSKAIAPAIREVVALGFVEVTERGRPSKADWRFPSKYRLTYRHTDTHKPTDEWRSISSAERARKLAIAAREAKDQQAVERSKAAAERQLRENKKENSQGVEPPQAVRGKNGPTQQRGENTPTVLGENIPNYLDSREGGRDVA